MAADQAERRRYRGMTAQNRGRQAETLGRREKMLTLLRPNWGELVATPRPAGGRLPKKRWAHEFLEKGGLKPSERDLRWLLKQLG
jgi:hypothetical protein